LERADTWQINAAFTFDFNREGRHLCRSEQLPSGARPPTGALGVVNDSELDNAQGRRAFP
jgi:hypothetical protein